MQPFKSVSHIVHAGLDGLMFYFSGRDTAARSDQVFAFHRCLVQATPPWLREAIPSFDSVFVVFDPAVTDSHNVYRFARQLEFQTDGGSEGQHHRVPVWYGAPEANDLADIEALTGLSTQEIIETHTATRYRVFAVGFAPGFAYLGDSPDSLSVPRRDSPRSRVPAGAVALADIQSAVYPQQSPGGWQLLGLTPLTLFRLQDDPPALLQMGDTVSFYTISEQEYRHWEVL